MTGREQTRFEIEMHVRWPQGMRDVWYDTAQSSCDAESIIERLEYLAEVEGCEVVRVLCKEQEERQQLR